MCSHAAAMPAASAVVPLTPPVRAQREWYPRGFPWPRSAFPVAFVPTRRDVVNGDEQLSFDLWTYQLQRMQDSEQFFYDGLVFDQMNGIQSFIPTFLINFQFNCLGSRIDSRNQKLLVVVHDCRDNEQHVAGVAGPMLSAA